MDIAANVLALVGHTPLVALDQLARDVPSRIVAKCEFLNPGASIKDRCALYGIQQALADGRLQPGGTVVELTSGNMGTGLSLVCSQLGLKFIAVMSAGNSIERAQMIQAYGGRVVLVPQAPGSVPGMVSGEDLDLARQRTVRLVEELGAFRVDQFHNPSNPESHDVLTGAEIWQQTAGQVDAFVTSAGTGCTFVGVMRHLRRHNPNVRGYISEPATAAVLGGQPVTDSSHKIQGTGYASVPPQWDPELCCGSLPVTDDEAIAMARQLASTEGLLVGFSSGANVASALQLARSDDPPKLIVTVLPDSGMKYLSTDLLEPVVSWEEPVAG